MKTKMSLLLMIWRSKKILIFFLKEGIGVWGKTVVLPNLFKCLFKCLYFFGQADYLEFNDNTYIKVITISVQKKER